MATILRIQISDSGAFDSTSNGVEFDLLDFATSKDARISTIDIPSSDGGIVQTMGARLKEFRSAALGLGDIDVRNQKEASLDRIMWHSSSASWQGRPASLSVLINGSPSIQEDVVLTTYTIAQRRGRPEIHDVDIEFIAAGN